MPRGVVVIAAVLVAAMAAILLWKAAYPTYAHRYRMTIEIEADGKLHTGSSVVEVRWAGQPNIGGGPFIPRVLGEAAVVDLGSRGVVVASLFNGLRYGIAPDGAVDAIFLAARAFGNDSTLERLPALPRLTGLRYLHEENLPRLIWFKDRKNPKSAQVIKAEDVPKLFGPDARLKTAYVEITKDPIRVDIGSKLPWYPELAKRQRGFLTFRRVYIVLYDVRWRRLIPLGSVVRRAQYAERIALLQRRRHTTMGTTSARPREGGDPESQAS